MKNKLLALRKQRNLSQDVLAAMAGISRATLSGLENGHINAPSTRTLRRLAKALDCDVSDFFTVRKETSMTYNTTHFLTEAALLFQDRLDRIDEADTFLTCQREADKATGIVDTLRTFANCLSDQDQIDDIYELMEDWENQISDHLAEKADELGCDGGTTEQEPTP